jgi:predicted AlkP superfamily phosphohydrolase/phosphomutase
MYWSAFIAIDASQYTLVERGMADGSLPNLRRLREMGTWCEIDSTANWGTGTPWATFFTGTYPPEHGYSFFLQWRPELMKHQRPDLGWIDAEPFYRRLPEGGPKTVAIDTPLCFDARPFNGIEVVSWSAHDTMTPFHTHPPELAKEILQQHGNPPVGDEVYGPQRPKDLLRQRDQLMESAILQTDLAINLVDKNPFDFFMITYGGVHRAGHKLWDHTSARGDISEQEKHDLNTALHKVTTTTDREVGRLDISGGNGNHLTTVDE